MRKAPWNRQKFAAKLRNAGASAYHDKHPFHVLMNSGKLSRESIRRWVANRFYYQVSIPLKDAAILSNCPLREVRRLWLHRLLDHDGAKGQEGGIGAWLQLGRACGLSQGTLLSGRLVLPAVRFAVDAYVNFARCQPWPIAVASSLTELFAPDLMAKRLEAFERFYPWIDPHGLQYFRNRLTQAPRDSREALRVTLTHCASLQMQEDAVAALRFKCDVLWAMLDAIHGVGSTAPARTNEDPL